MNASDAPEPAQRPSPAAASPGAIELKGINKSFGPVRANRDIDLKVKRGTIHGIVGENGAGKSTLMSILYGFYTADSGEIRVNDKPAAITDSRHALALGIGMVGMRHVAGEGGAIFPSSRTSSSAPRTMPCCAPPSPRHARN